MLHTSCQIAAETSARRECSQLPIPTIDKKRICILLPLFSTAVELTEVVLSSTLQSERKVNSQIPVSPHPLSDFFKFTVTYYKQKLSMRRFSTVKYQKAAS